MNASAASEIKTGPASFDVLAWIAAIFISFGCLTAGFALPRAIGIFEGMFNGLGVELPFATSFLIVNRVWLFLLFFGGAAIFLIAKERLICDARRRLSVTGIVLMAALSFMGLVHHVLYLPVLDLMRKLSQTK